MKIVITGASGLLGRYLLKTQPMKNEVEGAVDPLYDITACYRTHKIDGIRLDVSIFAEVIDRLFTIKPDIIIHCAANGDVDSVEQNPSEAVRSDLQGVINLVNYCELSKCKLITISSNAVYKGDNPPYNEDSPREPVNLYGKIKSLADDIVMKSKCEWMIVRPIFMYGWNYPHGRDNWATRIIKDHKEVSLVGDSFTQPTYAGDVAEFIWFAIQNESWGFIWNYSASEAMSIWKFGCEVYNVFELEGMPLRCKLDSFPTIAPRPIDTCFDVIEKKGNVYEGLTKMKNEKINGRND